MFKSDACAVTAAHNQGVLDTFFGKQSLKAASLALNEIGRQGNLAVHDFIFWPGVDNPTGL